MTSDNTELGFFFLGTIALVAAIAYIDFIVNRTLYDYGLKFSWSWAIPYWSALWTTFLIIAALVMTTYWIRREETLRNARTAVLLGITVILTSLNFDLLWFAYLWRLPAWNEVWWWYPFYWLLGLKWTTFHQVAFTVAVDSILAGLWAIHFTQPLQRALSRAPRQSRNK